MPQSLANIYLHLVFSTKERTPFLSDKEIRKEMHAYMASIFKKQESSALIVGGTEDHVHILFNLSRKLPLTDIVRDVKRSSSIWIKKKGRELDNFSWQNGYGAFSVSRSKLDEVERYIKRQENHHEKMKFQDELRALLKKQGIQYDERFIWD